MAEAKTSLAYEKGVRDGLKGDNDNPYITGVRDVVGTLLTCGLKDILETDDEREKKSRNSLEWQQGHAVGKATRENLRQS